jgi:FAD/FMN-containing dehydrogenase
MKTNKDATTSVLQIESGSKEPPALTTVSGWGRYPQVKSRLTRPESLSALERAITGSSPLIARGLGRAYGDAAACDNGTTVLTERIGRFLAFNEITGVLRAEAGVSLSEILATFVPRGWFLPVTPGTKHATIGGAVACDVHGKNHHVDGSFCRSLKSLTLCIASGKEIECSPNENADIFWATIGGMGLTGVIKEVELALIPIESSYINLHSIKSANLEETFTLFRKHESAYQYSVAWLDCLASGDDLGRCILLLGNHAKLAELNDKQKVSPLAVNAKPALPVPFDMPSGLLNAFTMSTFNNLYYAKQQQKEVKSIIDYGTFFYPLDVLNNWNRMYGKAGFIQYQCVFPLETSKAAIIKLLSLSQSLGYGSFLAVLKRFGASVGEQSPGEEYSLSFPIAGYTLTLDMPVKPGLFDFTKQLDQIVLEFNGRIYLAKDSCLGPEEFRQMYPAFSKWLTIKKKVDPNNVFSSHLSNRLKLSHE